MKLEKKSYTVLCQEKNSITRDLGKKLDHVSFWGTVDLCIGQHLGQLSIDIPATMSADTRSTLDQYDGDTRYSLSVNSRPILCRRIPWSTCWLKCRSTCQSMNWSSGSLVSANCWSQEAASWLIWDWYLVTTVYRSIVGR